MKLTIFHSPPFGRNILSSIRIFSTFFLHQPKNPTATYIWSCIFLWKNLQNPLKDVGSWKGSGRMDQGGDLVRTSGLTFKTSTKTPGRQAGSSCCRWWMCLNWNRQPGAMDPTKTQVCFFSGQLKTVAIRAWFSFNRKLWRKLKEAIISMCFAGFFHPPVSQCLFLSWVGKFCASGSHLPPGGKLYMIMDLVKLQRLKTRPPIGEFRREIPLFQGKSRLVKYYNLGRWMICQIFATFVAYHELIGLYNNRAADVEHEDTDRSCYYRSPFCANRSPRLHTLAFHIHLSNMEPEKPDFLDNNELSTPNNRVSDIARCLGTVWHFPDKWAIGQLQNAPKTHNIKYHGENFLRFVLRPRFCASQMCKIYIFSLHFFRPKNHGFVKNHDLLEMKLIETGGKRQIPLPWRRKSIWLKSMYCLRHDCENMFPLQWEVCSTKKR